MAGTVASDHQTRAQRRSPDAADRPWQATGLLAVGFAAAPAVHWARRGVDRLLHGDDAVAVLDAISRHAAVADPADPLRAVAAGVRRALAIPYVGLTIHCGPTVEAGSPPGGASPVARFSLRYQGRELGTMRAVPGSPRVRRLLGVLAGHVAVLVHAALATHELAAARLRIVAAREAERLELRRDLHDGLGPALIGLAMEVKAARRCHGPAAALLASVERDLAGCGAELRAVVEGLRPPDLDGGLVRAVAAKAGRMAHDGLTIHVLAPPELPAVAPAVEVAAFRIAGEALANAVRHSGATTCAVRLVAGRALVLEVTDNGHGRDADPPAAVPGSGLGLASMRERAAEVGGALDVLPASPRGTMVRATLPWDGV
jgi:signal transduction histidine kinase